MAFEIKPPTASAPPPGQSPAPLTAQPKPGSALSALLSQSPKQVLDAKVIAATQASESQRQQLLQNHLASGRAANLPTALKQLLSSAQLQLIKLQAQQQTFTTFTDKPLKPGDRVQLRLETPPPHAPREGQRGQPQSASLLNIPAKTAQAGALIKLQLAPSSANSPFAGIDTRTASAQISEALRTVLPRQQPLQPLLNALTKLAQLPKTPALPAGGEQVREISRQLLQRLPTPQQLSQPAALKAALHNSGIELEHRLAQQRPMPQQTPPPIRASSSLLTTGNSGHGPQADPTKVAGNTPPVPITVERDLKAGLLKLLGQLLPGTASGRTSPPQLSQLLAQQPPGQDGGSRLLQLLEALLGTTTPATPPSREQQQQLTQLVQQQLLAGLAKLQQQQLQALNHQLGQAEQPQQTQSWNLELPLRLGQETSSVHIQIDEDWVEPPEEESQTKDKVRQWEVLLSFDLPVIGAFHAQLKVIQDQVAASLWAETTEALQAAREQLQQLREQLQNQGVQVTKLDCFQGRPPSRRAPLSYSLIDITT